MHVLVLGGTRDAMNLAEELLCHPRLTATYSLAGRTRRPLPSGLPTRSGGFGGVPGLIDWLRRHEVDAVVDATHPFAAQMSTHAIIACGELGVPLLRLSRKPWRPEPGDDWLTVADLDAAATQLREVTQPGQCVLLTTGTTTLHHFSAIDDRHFVVRCIDAPNPAPAFGSWTLITDRGPFDLTQEKRLLADHQIDILVTKNSGGPAAQPKLEAARAVGLPVIMVNRPAIPPADQELYQVADVIASLETQLS